MLGKASIIAYLCHLSGGSRRVTMFYLFGGREVSKIGHLCLCVTKAVWKNWGLRVSIWHKGTTRSGASLGPLYIQGICWAPQYIWSSTKCHTTGMIQKTLNFGGGWHLPWHQKHFHKEQSNSLPCQTPEILTPSLMGPTASSVKWLPEWALLRLSV